MKSRAPRRGIPARVPLLTTTQVTAVLDVSVRTLHRYMDDGRIRPAGTVGLGYVFDECEVAELRRHLELGRKKAREENHGKGEPER